ncbi:MAG: hypothetical protein AAF591_17080 [Verrucomicrobiota bacterium]
MSTGLETYLKGIRDRLQGLKEKNQPTPITLSHDSEHLKLEGINKEKKKDSILFSWNEIVGAYAYKLDLYTVDCICIKLELTGGRELSLNEEMIGWHSLIEAFPKYLSGFKKMEDWFMEVASPAFETNLTKLYTKEQNQAR